MKSKLLAILLLCGSLLSFTRGKPDPVFPSAYLILNLGMSRQIPGPGAYDINNQGDIVGSILEGGCVWRFGKYSRPELLHETIGVVLAVNDKGEMAGLMGVASEDRTRTHGFGRRNDKIETLPEYAEPKCINNRGVIAGNLEVFGEKKYVTVTGEEVFVTEYEQRGFVWQEGKFQSLPSLGGNFTEVNDINDQGTLVGRSYLRNLSDDEKGPGHACLWRDGKITDLDAFGGKYSEAGGSNNKGEVVGMFTDMKEREHAFLWREGKMTELECPAGSDGCAATDINNQGVVMGYITFNKKDAFKKIDFHIALWHKGKRLDVTARLLNPHGWGTLHTKAINDKGQIVGYGDYDGVRSAFVILPIYTLPAPPR
jgi:probable HAF family extracellular repeat protein